MEGREWKKIVRQVEMGRMNRIREEDKRKEEKKKLQVTGQRDGDDRDGLLLSIHFLILSPSASSACSVHCSNFPRVSLSL